ncbi:tRNA (adenosine(37)-N6)-threonylcarbamoyltransferase complex dimerization subunit type 1 TsaB [Pseudooceanicola sp.]|uniref:tRNA (adenosine(37)-N6)-threonylcarbamoyltransferase complex dimerization subunit type 1 TsaB n=1 Tax=Pseudooceanicola sp. TaxID=1914328 RepID=UPI0035C70B99
MSEDPLILAFDTSAAHCAAALLSGDHILATAAQSMTRGQAEALFPLLKDLLSQTGKTWQDIDRIGVGTGPGNFTGIRIAISAARGLGLSLNCPVIGVTSFAAIHHGAPGATATVLAPRDMAYVLTPGAATPNLVPLASVEAPTFPPEPEVWAAAIASIARDADANTAAPPAPVYLRPADAAPARDIPPVIVP